jgi:single-strand DNA-binding protein
MNHVTLFGNLGADPELRTTQNGTNIVKLSIATGKYVQQQWQTTWHTVMVWGKAADATAQKAQKGMKCLVVGGELVYRQWTNQQGEQKNTTEVHTWQRPTFVQPAPSQNQQQQPHQPAQAQPQTQQPQGNQAPAQQQNTGHQSGYDRYDPNEPPPF